MARAQETFNKKEKEKKRLKKRDDKQKKKLERKANAEKPNSLEELKEFYKDRYYYKGPADVKIIETMEESFREKAAEGGLMNLGGKEMDLREEGGFVPLGRMERADDVPARLSKNEFVFTADAVRNAGEGDIDKGAEVMYNMMKNLESGGEVSEESQGLDGAREMFQTSQRLEEVL